MCARAMVVWCVCVSERVADAAGRAVLEVLTERNLDSPLLAKVSGTAAAHASAMEAGWEWRPHQLHLPDLTRLTTL